MLTPLLHCCLQRALVLLLLSALLASATAQAQPEPIKFGQLDPADLTAAPFVADSAAFIGMKNFSSAARVPRPFSG